MLPTALLGQLMKARFLLDQHASTILTGMGVAGTVSTAVLTGRATVKAVHEIDAATKRNEREYLEQMKDDSEIVTTPYYPALSKLEVARLIWPLYIPPAFTGITTIMA